MSNPMNAIQVESLRKNFGRQEILRGVNLDVPAGSIFGFLGLNGAGKTTLIRMLLGLLRPDAGRCVVDGIDSATKALELRRRVGYMAENQTMYGWMRVGQLIEWVSRFYPSWDSTLAETLRQQMRLDAAQKVGALSKGQTSHLALLLALAHRPNIVILDDPTLGLDPIARRDLLRDVISQLQDRGATVFFSSHLLYEIEPICDRIAILHEGQIIKCAPVDELRETVKRIVLKPTEGARVPEIPGLLDFQAQDGQWSLTVEHAEEARRALTPISRGEVLVTGLNLDEIFEAHVIGRREVSRG
ncbi:MAG TPA: ABC transporter ATP-binding protein [Verrucomicrobiae bacterium]|nr:ABC transporter ATP-binding protein [Verrucomicrobiae bacterium]